ncbi:DHA2 family efflux MFS transporter permease subunit [Tomitella fengzijianii]|uniref:DHA2 family efflux MFS transporter permease subunit n=1 Tax=Tomitella fengzijianii TaxID=2597660 RepID=A0A516X0E7_9ACTN|nr:DHA2 family efflux MFS transporter permease subunit [Tomitella fengzijianii]QDQ96559.1 DHA2 family efflux MFS transporter permease subunit [Tomitella fengzijianii]
MTSSNSPGAAAPPGGVEQPAKDPTALDAKLLKVAGVVVLGAIMAALDMTVVNVAIPTFQEAFDASYADVAWSVTAYTLALATVIPLTGWAADRFGTKRLYMTALVLFVIGSVACSLAWSLEALIGFRVLQGLGGGMLMPLSMTILTRAAGPQRIGRVMALLGVPMLLGPIGGPILGGWLIDAVSWHWIFLINVPVGALAILAAVMVLPKDETHPGEKFDFLGMLLLSPGLALFLFGVSSIPEEGTIAATRVLGPGIAGLVLMVVFVLYALRKKNALIDLSLFKDRNLTISVVTLILFVVAFMGTMMLLPSYFMQIRGESTLMAGLLVAPQGIGAMISMPIGGKLVDKFGPKFVVLPGIALIVLGLGGFTQAGVDTSFWYTGGSLFVMGLGMGWTMMPLMTSALATLTDHRIARGSTLMNIVQQTGASIGAAVMSVVLTNQMIDHGVDSAKMQSQQAAGGPVPPGAAEQMQQLLNGAADAFSNTFVVSVVIVALTLIPAAFLPRKKIAPTDVSGEEIPETPDENDRELVTK